MGDWREKKVHHKPDVRRFLLAKVHIAASELGLSDLDYRATLRWLFGAASAKELNDVELDKLLRHFESKGWVPKDKQGKPRPPRKDAGDSRPDIRPGVDSEREGLMRKIEALLAEKGRLENKRVPWAYAESILRRQGGGEYLNWATFDALLKVVQSLSYHVKRLKKAVN
ncbi:MAG: regulatory protein GemA [Deltaproteobacteria bacterium]|jgi:hypothetical protein|nr:regulatory protein GemA [Deltaproteobacteria bacterium]